MELLCVQAQLLGEGGQVVDGKSLSVGGCPLVNLVRVAPVGVAASEFAGALGGLRLFLGARVMEA